jgi:uncharacterized membrane protein YvlD (DUF360 family)
MINALYMFLFVLLAAALDAAGVGYRSWQYWAVMLIALALSVLPWVIRLDAYRRMKAG